MFALPARRDEANGSALEWGSRMRRFKSFHPDKRFKGINGNMNSLFSLVSSINLNSRISLSFELPLFAACARGSGQYASGCAQNSL